MPARNSHPQNLVFQPHAHEAVQRGIQQMVAPIRATLGPLARHVALASSFPGQPPELLDKGSVIARRIVALPDRDADMGAMLVRHLLWRLHQSVGDCTATAAVLFQAVYDSGLTYLAAGGNPIRLRDYIEEGLAFILAELDRLTCPVSGQSQLAEVGRSICHDPQLVEYLAEILDTLGPYGYIDIRTGQGRDTTRQYVEGAYWKAGIHSTSLLPGGARVELDKPAILLTDLSLDEPYQVAPAIEAALLSGRRSLVVVANQVSDAVTAFLLANRDAAGFMSLAVKIPEPLLDRPGTFADLTALVGGRAFLVAAGDTLSSVKPHDLGNAAFAWADKDYLGLVEGMGDEDARAQHIEALQSAFDRSTEVDQRIRLLERLGKFVGGSAILWTGGATDSEIAFRKQMVEATVPAMRAALREGVVPGGGAALLACKPVLRNRQAQSSNADERVAYNILLKAMDVPLRTIVANAGHDPAEVMAAISCKDGLRCFDVLGGKVVDVLKAGILDVAAAYKAAVQSAVSTAALTLTIDVLVHSRKPEQVIDPG